MIGWLILAAYIIGFYPSLKYFAKRTLMRVEREYPLLVSSPARYAREAREAVYIGILPTLVWPISFPLHFIVVYMVDRISGNIETPRMKQMKQEEEIETLRRLAREHGLPLPGLETPARTLDVRDWY